jgi:hypothetical protein
MLHDSSQPNKYTRKYYLRGPSVSAFNHREYSTQAGRALLENCPFISFANFMAPIKPVCGFV